MKASNSKIRIYADTNIYCRPFDDLSIPKIALEAESARIIFERIPEKTNFILLGSDILEIEIQKIKNVQKRFWASSLLSLCKEKIEESDRVKDLAEEIFSEIKLSPRDSIHLASAILGGVKYFLTFDSDFLRKADLIKRKYKIKVVNPIDFIKIL